jgi:hypoxanthine phosphoribosyltransferase
VATKKKTTTRRPAPRARKLVAKKPTPIDEFSAAGGMPSVPSLPTGELGRARRGLIELQWGEFDRHVQSLARAISRAFRPEVVVGLVHGGVFVGGALANALKAEFLPLRLTRRSRDSGSTPQATEELPEDVTGRRVLIVDDVAASGDSIVFATRLARAHGVKQVKTVSLIARPGRFEPDFVAITSDEFFVFPWDYQDVVEDRRFDTGEFPAPAAVKKSSAR